MPLCLNIHANGAYDVALEVGNEETLVEYCDYSLDPFALDALVQKYALEGHQVRDFRSEQKKQLAADAHGAAQYYAALKYRASHEGGVEPEALAMARTYANEKIRLATEVSV